MNPIIPWAIIASGFFMWGLCVAVYAPRLFRGASKTDAIIRRRLRETRRNGSAPSPDMRARALKAANRRK